MTSTNCQVTDIKTINLSNIIISEYKADTSIGGKSVTNATTGRMMISYKYPDGSVGPLLISTLEDRTSFGLNENKQYNGDSSSAGGNSNGYNLNICLYSMTEDDKVLKRETEWIESYKKIMDYLSNWCYENRRLFKKPMLQKVALEGFGKIYQKVDNTTGEIIGKPNMYAKLIENRSKGIMITKFYETRDGNLREIENYKDLIGLRCNITAILRIESIYVGGLKVSPQVKVQQVLITKRAERFEKCLFSVAKPEGFLEQSATDLMTELVTDKSVKDDADDGSIDGDDDNRPAASTPAPKPVIRKVVKKP